MAEATTWWVDGVPAGRVSVQDRGLAYGDGVFETMRAEGGRVRLLSQHLDRLAVGAERLGFKPPPRDLLERAVDAACANEADSCVLKLIVTRGDGTRGYRPPQPAQPRWVLMKTPLVPVPATLRVRWCATPLARNPALAGLKHLNRLEQVLARSEWADDWDDGLMCDTSGAVIAATRANLFVVAGGKLLTPSLEHSGVAGIMRAMVGEAATALGIGHRVGEMTRDAVTSADEWFLCNAVHGIMPVARLGELERTAPGPVATQVAEWVANHD